MRGRQGQPTTAGTEPEAAWTYELPPEGAAAEGLEGYGVESAAGEWVGTVRLALRNTSCRYLAVRRLWTLRRDLRLVPWSDDLFVDHEARTVRLALAADQLTALPRLQRGKGVRGERADLKRFADTPAPDSSISVARADPLARRYFRALGLSALGFLGLLAAFALASGPRWHEGDLALFVIPGALLVGALTSALGLFDRPRQASGRGPRSIESGTVRRMRTCVKSTNHPTRPDRPAREGSR
jgi:hypothetical protein